MSCRWACRRWLCQSRGTPQSCGLHWSVSAAAAATSRSPHSGCPGIPAPFLQRPKHTRHEDFVVTRNTQEHMHHFISSRVSAVSLQPCVTEGDTICTQKSLQTGESTGIVKLQKVDPSYSHLARNAQVGTLLWEGFIVKYSTQTQQSCCNLNETSSDLSLGVRRCVCPDTQHLPLWGRLQRETRIGLGWVGWTIPMTKLCTLAAIALGFILIRLEHPSSYHRS